MRREQRLVDPKVDPEQVLHQVRCPVDQNEQASRHRHAFRRGPGRASAVTHTAPAKNPSALLTFIVVVPGTILARAGTPTNHPVNTSNAMAATERRKTAPP